MLIALAGSLFKSTSSSMDFSDYLNLLASVIPVSLLDMSACLGFC